MSTGAERWRWGGAWCRGFVATVLVLSCVACGERAEPVAGVTLGVDRDELPRGRHLTVAYRFDVFRETAAAGGDYRVFVHFLTTEGEVIWQDDHSPPVPIGEWRAGETVEYTRRVALPPYPYIGPATVAVGIYSQSTGERLPLLAEDLGGREYLGTTVTFVPGHESSMLFYEEGWYGEEGDRASDERWRWIGNEAGVTFRNPRADATLYLDVQAAPLGVMEGPQSLRVRVGEMVVQDLSLELGERRFLEIALPREDLGEEATVSLGIEVAPSFVPASSSPGGVDERELGVRVYYVYVD